MNLEYSHFKTILYRFIKTILYRFKEMVIYNKMNEYQEIEFIDENGKVVSEKDLTVYHYDVRHEFSEEYFVGYEIAALLGYKNPAEVIKNNVSKCNQIVFKDFPGEKIPELDPRVNLISRDGAIEILIKTRKRISADVLHILKRFGIDTTNRKCLTKEQQTLSSLTNTFKTEKFEDQYKVGPYYLDLYFPDYKIVIECDENGHADRKPHNERERMDYVNGKLGLTDDNWVRYNPDEKDFDISKVMGQIYIRISLMKKIDNSPFGYMHILPSINKDISIMKTCRKCNQSININFFRKSGNTKDGRIYCCFNCDKISIKKRNILVSGVKKCFDCKQNKNFDEFSDVSKNLDGKCSYCKECSNNKQSG